VLGHQLALGVLPADGPQRGGGGEEGLHAVLGHQPSWSMANIYDIGPGEVMCTASDVGWVVGHSYIVYVGHQLALGVLPADGPQRGGGGEEGLHAVLGHQPLDPETWSWAGRALDIPVVDHWWQTETGWAISGNPRQPRIACPGSTGRARPPARPRGPACGWPAARWGQTETGWAISGNPVGLEQLPLKSGSSTVPIPGYERLGLPPVIDHGDVQRPARPAPGLRVQALASHE
jgi:propionyl-CoA synthetase